MPGEQSPGIFSERKAAVAIVADVHRC